MVVSRFVLCLCLCVPFSASLACFVSRVSLFVVRCFVVRVPYFDLCCYSLCVGVVLCFVVLVFVFCFRVESTSKQKNMLRGKVIY